VIVWQREHSTAWGGGKEKLDAFSYFVFRLAGGVRPCHTCWQARGSGRKKGLEKKNSQCILLEGKVAVTVGGTMYHHRAQVKAVSVGERKNQPSGGKKSAVQGKKNDWFSSLKERGKRKGVKRV